MSGKIEISKVVENIRVLRPIKGMKAEDIAHQLGITKSSYSDIETGKSELTLNRLQKIADILEVNYNTILNAHSDSFQYFTNSPNAGINNINQNTQEISLMQAIIKTQESLIVLIEKISNKFN